MAGWLGCSSWAGGVVCCWPEDVPAPAAPCALTGAENIITPAHKGNKVRARRIFISENLLGNWITNPAEPVRNSLHRHCIFLTRKRPTFSSRICNFATCSGAQPKHPQFRKSAIVAAISVYLYCISSLRFTQPRHGCIFSIDRVRLVASIHRRCLWLPPVIDFAPTLP